MAGEEEHIQKILQSLNDLASMERQASTAEINLLGTLRDRMSPVARYGDPIVVKYRVLNFKTDKQSEQTAFLPEGFPTMEGTKPLLALPVLDNYTMVNAAAAGQQGKSQSGEYAGDCLFLSIDRKWILAERTGAFSREVDSSSDWEASCKLIPDRVLLERYSLETVADGLLAVTNKVWMKVSPRMDALKKRFEKVEQVSSDLAKLKAAPREEPKKESVVEPGRQHRQSKTIQL